MMGRSDGKFLCRHTKVSVVFPSVVIIVWSTTDRLNAVTRKGVFVVRKVTGFSIRVYIIIIIL